MPSLILTSPPVEMAGDPVLVGSSPALLGSGLGFAIDSFPEIVRFNRAPTAGFEADVGSRTTLRVANTHVAMCLPIGNWTDGGKGQPKDFVADLRNVRILCWGPKNTPVRAHASSSVHFPKFDNPDFPRTHSYLPAGKSLSVGTGFVLLCVLSGLVPRLCGFSIDADNHGHYWEPKPPPGGCHDFSAERTLLASLRDTGKLVVL